MKSTRRDRSLYKPSFTLDVQYTCEASITRDPRSRFRSPILTDSPPSPSPLSCLPPLPLFVVVSTQKLSHASASMSPPRRRRPTVFLKKMPSLPRLNVRTKRTNDARITPRTRFPANPRAAIRESLIWRELGTPEVLPFGGGGKRGLSESEKLTPNNFTSRQLRALPTPCV